METVSTKLLFLYYGLVRFRAGSAALGMEAAWPGRNLSCARRDEGENDRLNILIR
jgi:hypothetical protein